VNSEKVSKVPRYFADRPRVSRATASIRDAALGCQPMINGGTVRHGRTVREIFGASVAKWLSGSGQTVLHRNS
jgi:hypothetical protein